MYLDTLKVSTIEQSAEQTSARGGLGNSELIIWDYGKEISLTLEDALYTPASQSLMWGGKFGIRHSKIYGVWNPFVYPKDRYGKPIYLQKNETAYCEKYDLWRDIDRINYDKEEYDTISYWKDNNRAIKPIDVGRLVVNIYVDEQSNPQKVVIRLPHRILDNGMVRAYNILFNNKGQAIDQNEETVLNSNILTQLDSNGNFSVNYMEDTIIPLLIPSIVYMENILREKDEEKNYSFSNYLIKYSDKIDTFESSNWENVIDENFILYKVKNNNGVISWWPIPTENSQTNKAYMMQSQINSANYYSYICPCTGDRKNVIYYQNNKGQYKYYKAKNDISKWDDGKKVDQLDMVQRIVDWTGLYGDQTVSYKSVPVQDNTVGTSGFKTGLYWYSKDNHISKGEEYEYVTMENISADGTKEISIESRGVIENAEYLEYNGEKISTIINDNSYYITIDGVKISEAGEEISEKDRFYNGLGKKSEWYKNQMPERAELILENYSDFEYNQSKLFYQPYQGVAINGVEQGPIPICRKMPYNVILDDRWPLYAYSYTWEDCDVKMISLQGEQEQYYIENVNIKCYVPTDTNEKQFYISKKILSTTTSGRAIHSTKDMKADEYGQYKYKYTNSEYLPKLDVYKAVRWPVPAGIDQDSEDLVTEIKVGTFYIIDEWNKSTVPAQDFIYEINSGIDDISLFERLDKYEAKQTFAINVDRNLIMNNYRNLPQYQNNELTVYIDPRTMRPYEANSNSFYRSNGQMVEGDFRVIKQGEIYYKWTRNFAQDYSSLGRQIIVDAKHFPGVFKLVGETFARNRLTGKDSRYQFEIPLCKFAADTNLNLEAAGDPTTFSMNLKVLRRDDGVMMKLSQYDVECNLDGTEEVLNVDEINDDGFAPDFLEGAVEMDKPEDKVSVPITRRLTQTRLKIQSPSKDSTYFFPYDNDYTSTVFNSPTIESSSENIVDNKKKLVVALNTTTYDVNGVKTTDNSTGEVTYSFEDGATEPNADFQAGYSYLATNDETEILSPESYTVEISEAG